MWYIASTSWHSSCRQFFLLRYITTLSWHKCIYGVRDEIILLCRCRYFVLHLSALRIASCLAIVNLLYSLLQSLLCCWLMLKAVSLEFLMTKGLHGQAWSGNPQFLLWHRLYSRKLSWTAWFSFQFFFKLFFFILCSRLS